MKGVPRNYKEQPAVREAYEEGGRSIGRAILYQPDREAYFWNLLKGLDLWPRWYLLAFKGLYCEENPLEHRRAVKNRYRKGKRLKRRRQEAESALDKARDPDG